MKFVFIFALLSAVNGKGTLLNGAECGIGSTDKKT